MKRPLTIVATALIGLVATALIGLSVTSCSNEPEDQPIELEEAFEWNLKGLLSSDGNVRGRAFEVYQRNWRHVRQYTEALAERTDVPTRIAGAYLVGRLGTREDLPVLRKFLADDAFVVRKMAMTGVVRLKDVASVPTLVGLLPEAKYAEVRVILRTLIPLDLDAGEKACVGRAADERWSHRRAAAEALGLLESVKSGLLLEQLLKDPVWLVQKDAAKAVGRRRYQGGHSAVLKLLDSEYWAVRAAVAAALGGFGHDGDLTVVEKLAFEDPEKGVRIAAVEALAGFSQDSVIPLIQTVLHNETEHQKVHKAAIRCLIRMGKGKPANLVNKFLEGDDEGLRKLARVVLREEGVPIEQESSAPPRKE
jgi:HEAT repeat protein